MQLQQRASTSCSSSTAARRQPIAKCTATRRPQRVASATGVSPAPQARDQSALAPAMSRLAVVTRATEFVGAVTAKPEWKFGVVVARFNSLVTKQLLEGAHEVFARHGVPSSNVDVAWVPGSFELPVVAQNMALSGQYSAIVCIGAVIQGATTHYDAVVSAATSGVMSASTSTGVPVVFGVLTTDNLEQALDRAGGKIGNKGGEAALTAIEMASLLDQLAVQGKAVKPKSA